MYLQKETPIHSLTQRHTQFESTYIGIPIHAQTHEQTNTKREPELHTHRERAICSNKQTYIQKHTFTKNHD